MWTKTIVVISREVMRDSLKTILFILISLFTNEYSWLTFAEHKVANRNRTRLTKGRRPQRGLSGIEF